MISELKEPPNRLFYITAVELFEEVLEHQQQKCYPDFLCALESYIADCYSQGDIPAVFSRFLNEFWGNEE